MVAIDDTEPVVSREEYATFISQIELIDIWLVKANITNHRGPQTPDRATFNFHSTAEWESTERGFRVSHHYTVGIETSDAVFANFEVSFGLDFTSKIALTEPFFAIFQDVNLSVNTWPYLREFVSTTMGRMGWSSFTIPALKQGVKRAKRPTKAISTRSPRRRKPQPPPE
jgi:hypothetical protein